MSEDKLEYSKKDIYYIVDNIVEYILQSEFAITNDNKDDMKHGLYSGVITHMENLKRNKDE